MLTVVSGKVNPADQVATPSDRPAVAEGHDVEIEQIRECI